MNATQFYEQLSDQLSILPKNQRIAFAVNICDRLLPDYIDFYAQFNWGNPDILKRSIQCAKNAIANVVDEHEVKQLLAELEAVLPDTEEFTDPLGTYALNAACALFELLEYLLNQEIDHLLNISSTITDTIDFKLSELEEDLNEDEILNHPEMLKEWHHQLQISK
ncbi:hypothetical protein ASE74_21785 [Pedobacter sp. Leaf216]|uniref:DUF416 family protein n=1 Tax=Pedobacter sp. Leaf216 TaxID=1735684 RepID=UPI0006FE3C4D|nr:DUF416 family protein [Pedobacter sp. Leaf216]KQM72933.1 hypothetical protein ASE74_21785 [Pedobacter sp. Leaf216]